MLWIVLLSVLTQAPATATAVQLVKVYLGPIPSAEGFVTANKEFDDSYSDMRSEFAKDDSLKKDIALVGTIEQADLVVEIVFRGLEDSGARTGSATTTGKLAVGSSRPVLQKQLRGRLVVRGTDYSVPLDGSAGLKLLTYANEARNMLVQVRDWVGANRAVLARVKK